MPRTIDLNADLGEGCPWDRPLLDRVTSASICCGAHAGDPSTILQTLRWAGERGVVVGAHPSYPDREGFGRVLDERAFPEPMQIIRPQLADLGRWAGEAGVTLRFLKPHGALYNRAQESARVAIAILNVAAPAKLPVLGLPGMAVEDCARILKLPFISEGFADRRYRPDGRLVPRSGPDAILRDPVAIRNQVHWLVNRGIQSICIHGDDPRSVELADLVLATLKDAGVEPRSFA